MKCDVIRNVEKNVKNCLSVNMLRENTKSED